MGIVPLSNNKRLLINSQQVTNVNGSTITGTQVVKQGSTYSYEDRMSTFLPTLYKLRALYESDSRILIPVVMDNNSGVYNVSGTYGGPLIYSINATTSPMTSAVFNPSNTIFHCSTQNSAKANGILKLAVGAQAGKYLVYGNFCHVIVAGTDYTNIKFVARLNSNGTIDTTFQTSFSAIQFGSSTAGDIEAAVELSNGDILIGGNFHSINGNTAIRGLARLNASNGTLIASGHGIPYDSLFRPAATNQPNQDFVNGLHKDSSGRIYVIGMMKRDTATAVSLVRLTSALAVDSSFPTAPYTVVGQGAQMVSGVKEVGSYLYIWGRFDSFNGVAAPSFIRVNPANGLIAD